MSLEIGIGDEPVVNANPYGIKKQILPKLEKTCIEPKPVILSTNNIPEPPLDPPEDYWNDKDFGDYSPTGEVLVMQLQEDYISRCRYGALVINTKDVFIADVDVKENSSHPQLRSKEAYVEYFSRITDVLINDFMLYETHSGFRVIMTSDTCDPSSDLSQAYMDLFLADKLYAKCCIDQQCYRARLTPKPERVGMVDLDKDIFKTEQDWEEEYSEACYNYDVCEPVCHSNKRVTRNCDKYKDFASVHSKYTIRHRGVLA